MSSSAKPSFYRGSITSLDDLISIASSGRNYRNLKTKKLRAILPELLQLKQLVGLEHIKLSIFEQLLFYLQNLHRGSQMYLNTVIYGPPGVGKTTIAKLLGKMFAKLCLLSQPDLFAIARRDSLVGEYLGQTAVKTQQFLEDHLGGVVLIDEVYSMGAEDGKDSFSREAIDTINLFLSENREDFMLIVAGYESEIESRFFRFNPGLKRRFQWYHTIEAYTPQELTQIFLYKVQQYGWKVAPQLDLQCFHRKEMFKDNAGSVENFLTRVQVKHSRRVITHSRKRYITQDDIDAALSEYKKKKEEPYHSMYL